MNLLNLIKNLKNDINKKNLDLTCKTDLMGVDSVANLLYVSSENSKELSELESFLVQNKDEYSLTIQLATKVAKSKKILSEISKKIHITVVFAIYKEHTRILTKQEHPHGEDFLVRKVSQMENLTKDFENITWDMLVVDDGCPENSGKIAQQIIEKKGLPNVKVLFLQDAIDQNLEIVQPLKSTDESRKGGSIEYGMWYASQQKHENHIVIFTDADLSTHLGQCGLLVDGIANRNKNSVIASRREQASVVVKPGTRNTRGKMFIYLWKRMLPDLNYITDTQCGFKAFKSETVNKIVSDMIEKKFAFDIELLLKTEQIEHKSIEKMPIAWIDSEAASTTTDLQPYLSMLKAIAAMYRKYLPANPESDSFAEFVENLTEEQWNKLVDNVPAEIAERNPVDFDVYKEVSVEQILKQISK